MKIKLKTLTEIDLMRESAEILAKVHGEIAKNINIGVDTMKLDKIAEEYIRDAGAAPSFKGFAGYPYTLCVSPNDVIVHGMPNSKPLESGDILSVDCGVCLNGYHSDSAYTHSIGEISEQAQQLLTCTKDSLYKAIDIVSTSVRIGDIGYTIQNYVENFGYSLPRELTGHGIGQSLHEPPIVNNCGKRGTGKKILNGMVLAIEPMVNLGRREIKQDKDGWTVRTKDNSLSAHFEHTVAIVEGKADILTTFKYIT